MEFHAQLQNVKIDLLFNQVEPDLIVNIDKMRIQQIIFNLLQNAIKFSTEGQTIQVSCEQFQISGSPSEIGVKIRVSDDGIGISEKDRKNLFSLYFKTQDEASRIMNPGSHGIGLNVCKRFA